MELKVREDDFAENYTIRYVILLRDVTTHTHTHTHIYIYIYVYIHLNKLLCELQCYDFL